MTHNLSHPSTFERPPSFDERFPPIDEPAPPIGTGLNPEQKARVAISVLLQDELVFSQSFHHECSGGDHDCEEVHRGIVEYEARKLQLYIERAARRLTGRPMPSGPIRDPLWAEEQEESVPWRHRELPPVGGQLVAAPRGGAQ